jgi:uncharacterized protein YidB (DUF937 family)
MKIQETQSHSHESASKTMTRRSRPWVAAGLAVGLLAGAGVSVAVALPFSAGASTENTAEVAKDFAGAEVQGKRHHGPTEGRGHRHHRGMRGGLKGELVESAALILDLTVDQLREKMRSGLTLSEIAKEQGVDRQDLIDALTATAIETMTAKINDRIPAIVDGEFGPRQDS